MDLPVRQIAYFVADIEQAALAHHAAFGSGPYYLGRHVPLALRGSSAMKSTDLGTL